MLRHSNFQKTITIRMSPDHLEQLLTDRFANSLFSMWNSLIILNGLLIGAISILYLVYIDLNKFIAFIIFFISSFAILLFIWNYYKFTAVYSDIKKVNSNDFENMSEEESIEFIKKDNQRFVSQGNWVRRRTKFAIGLTFINLIFFMLTIAFGKSFI
jgi:hypothetical protein